MLKLAPILTPSFTFGEQSALRLSAIICHSTHHFPLQPSPFSLPPTCAISRPMFTYQLPPSHIAHTPAEPRDSARMLHYPGLTETPFSALPDFLNAGDLLVLNTSQVIPARLFATRPSRTPGGAPVTIELLLHRALTPHLTSWQTYVRPARKLKDGDILTFADGTTASITRTPGQGVETELLVSYAQPSDTNSAPGAADGHQKSGASPVFHLEFHNLLNAQQVSAFLTQNGHTPLPPYIHTQDSEFIRKRYQTVYARQPGSVAAPTAGLHFTEQTLEKLRQKGVNVAHVTLHVGAGTFQNPTPEQLVTGKLHAEHAELTPDVAKLIKQTKHLGGNVIAVGTTALRTLESWAQKGMPDQGFNEETTIFIRPGYRFQIVDKLITNFHLPHSSLLMLVEAFIGPGISELYQHAIQNNFRFYSFGDTSLLTRQEPENT